MIITGPPGGHVFAKASEALGSQPCFLFLMFRTLLCQVCVYKECELSFMLDKRIVWGRQVLFIMVNINHCEKQSLCLQSVYNCSGGL